jgi:hypothetical protein
MTDAPTLTEFLLARLSEDEGELRGMTRFGGVVRPVVAGTVEDCESKRRIVEWCAPLSDMQVRRQTRTLANDVLCALASVYADHPDYQEEWRP